MKRTVLFLSFLLSCIVSMAGKMDNYTITPVSGSAVTEDDLKHVTLTFNDVDAIHAADFSVYVYDSPDRDGFWLTNFHIVKDENGKFEGNKVTMDLSELYSQYHGVLYFRMEKGNIYSESLDSSPRIDWDYALPSPFNNMEASPADGSTLAPGDFNKLTLTFPDITELKLNDSRMWCGFELRTVEDDKWLGQDNLHDYGTISGNTLSLDIKQEWKPANSCKVKFVIDAKALVDGATNIESSKITLIYDIATKQYECTVTPSNAEPLPITAFRNLTFTFDGAEKVEIPADISSMDAKKVHLRKYRSDGYEEFGFYDADDVTIDGNAVKIRMSVTAINGGKLMLLADEGAFIVDGNPSQEIKMEYEFLKFDTKFDVKCEDKLDSEDRLNVILPSDLRLEYAVVQGLTHLKNADGLPTEYLVEADYSKENNTAWFTFEKSGGDVLPDGEYHFYLKSESIVMFTDDIMVSSRPADIYFTKDSTSGIHDVRIVTDGKAYTIDGRPATSKTKGIIVVNGVKMVNK